MVALPEIVRRPLRRIGKALGHPLVFPIFLVVPFVLLLSNVIDWMTAENRAEEAKPKVVNGTYVAPHYQIRWQPDESRPLGPDLRYTRGTCAPDISFVAPNFTVGGTFSARITGYRLDSGWVGTVNENGEAVVTLNCFAYARGEYELTVTDQSTQKVLSFTFESEYKPRVN